MSAGNFTLTNAGKLALMNRAVDFVGGTLVGVLLAATYTPSLSDGAYSDISPDEIDDAGYVPQVLAGKAISLSGSTVKFDADDVSFGTNVSLTAQYIALVNRAAGALDTDDVVVGYMALETTGAVSSIASNFVARWNAANGLFTV